MDVILLERVEKLGQMGEVVKVRAGHARNYLIPQRKALRATKQALAEFEARRTQLEADNLHRRDEAAAVKAEIEGRSVVIIRQASEAKQLYGSVTARDIADAFTAAGVTVDRRQIKLEAPIKTLGIADVRVALHPEVDTLLHVNVARSQDEADIQAGKAPPPGDDEDDDALAEADDVAAGESNLADIIEQELAEAERG